MIVTTYIGDPRTSETLTPSSVTKLSRSKIYPRTGNGAGMAAKAAYISVEDASIMFTLDGTTASTTVRHELAAGESMVITGAVAVNQFQMIDKAGASKVKITYHF